MAIREIVEVPDPRLRQISSPVEEVTDEIRELVSDMFETMYAAPGIGLAAILVGVAKRILVIDLQEAEEEGGELELVEGDKDALFREAAELCIQHQGGSTSLLQRKLRIGYGRAARIIDQLHAAGILGPPDGSKPREVLIGISQLDEYSS